MPSKNPFAFKAKQQNKKKSTGKRVGKSKPEKANNQLNRRGEIKKEDASIEASSFLIGNKITYLRSLHIFPTKHLLHTKGEGCFLWLSSYGFPVGVLHSVQ